MEISLQSLLVERFDVKFWSTQVGRRVRREPGVSMSVDHGYITGVDWSKTTTAAPSVTMENVPSHERKGGVSAEVFLQFVTGESDVVNAHSSCRLFVYDDYMGTTVNERNCVGKFDYVVLGGGPAGLSAAQELARGRPEKSVCVLEWKKIFGGRPGQKLVGKTRSPYFLENKQAGYEYLKSKFSGYATCAQQPVDWVEVFWIRELFFWSVVGAIFCPASGSFRATLEKVFVSWLDRMGSEDCDLEDKDFVSQFHLPDERNQILSISETLVSEVFPIEEVGSRDVAKRKFLTTELVKSGVFQTAASNDMWKVVGEIAGVDGGVLKRLFQKFVLSKAATGTIEAAVALEFELKREEEAGEWVNLRTSEDVEADEAKMAEVVTRLEELARFEFVDETADIGNVSPFDLEPVIDELAKNVNVAMISESIVSGVEIVHAVGGNFSQGMEEVDEVVRVWFKRRNCLRFLLARGVVVALPFPTLTTNFQIYDSQQSELFAKIRKFAETFAINPDCKHFVFRVEKMCERPIPVEWRIPGGFDGKIGDVRSWRELLAAVQGITWTATNAKFRFVEVSDEDEEDCDWLVHCELPAFIATPNAKRDCKNFLQALISGLKLSDGTLLELENYPGRISPTDQFNAETHRRLCNEVSDGRVAVAGEFAVPIIGLLGSVAGAAVSGRLQAANLAKALEVKKEQGASDGESKRAVLTHTAQAVGANAIGRVGGANEERRHRRDDATLVAPGGAGGGGGGGGSGSNLISRRTGGKGEVDIPRHLVTTILMRNISALSDGWKYRKETRDFKVYFPKRQKLSLVLRDKQLITALMQTFPDELRRLNGFNELVRSRPENAEGDPYPLALDYFGVDSIDLPSIEELAFEGDSMAAAEAQVAAEWSDAPSEHMDEEDEAADALLMAQAGAAVKKNVAGDRFRVTFAYGRYLYELQWRDSLRDAARDWWVLRTVVDALEAPADKRNFINAYRNMSRLRIPVPAVLDSATKRRVRKYIDAQIKKYGNAAKQEEEEEEEEEEEDAEMSE